jgi:hypothetical protein
MRGSIFQSKDRTHYIINRTKIFPSRGTDRSILSLSRQPNHGLEAIPWLLTQSEVFTVESAKCLIFGVGQYCHPPTNRTDVQRSTIRRKTEGSTRKWRRVGHVMDDLDQANEWQWILGTKAIIRVNSRLKLIVTIRWSFLLSSKLQESRY